MYFIYLSDGRRLEFAFSNESSATFFANLHSIDDYTIKKLLTI